MDGSNFTFLGLVAFVGLILQLAILLNIEPKTPLTRNFAQLCLMLLLQDSFEFLAYITHPGINSLSLFFVDLHMLTLYFAPPAFMSLVLRLAESPRAREINAMAYTGAALIVVAHLGGQMVEGYRFVGWSVIPIPGPWYYFAMAIIGLTLILSMALLFMTALWSETPQVSSRCRVCLVAFLPVALVFMAVVGARMAGFQSSSAVSLSLATILFLFVMLHETRENLYWLSTKFRMVFALLFMDKSRTTEEVINELEDIRIRAALRATGGVQKDAAKLVCLPASTLNKKIARYGIDVKEFRPRSGQGSTVG